MPKKGCIYIFLKFFEINFETLGEKNTYIFVILAKGVLMAKKVILVDDSKTILATAEMALEDMMANGIIDFSTYLNPAELLEDLLSGQEDYDLLISDINMAQMSGLDLAEQLKSHDSFKNKPILILTTESSPEMKMRGKSIGVTGWMVKPFNDAKLVKAIQMVLGL